VDLQCQTMSNYTDMNRPGILRYPEYFYVVDSETNKRFPRLLAYFLLYKLTKSLDSLDVKLSVRVFHNSFVIIRITHFSLFWTCWSLSP